MGKQVMQKLIMIGSIILYNNLIKNLLKNKKKVITSIVLLKKTKDSTIQLFNQLPNSHGLISEEILEKLRLTVRSLIASQEENSKDLLDLCIDVIYHKDMKAFGLNQLYELYTQKYRSNQEVKDSDEE